MASASRAKLLRLAVRGRVREPHLDCRRRLLASLERPGDRLRLGLLRLQPQLLGLARGELDRLPLQLVGGVDLDPAVIRSRRLKTPTGAGIGSVKRPSVKLGGPKQAQDHPERLRTRT